MGFQIVELEMNGEAGHARSHSAAPSHRDAKANLSLAPPGRKIGRRFATVPQQQPVKPSNPTSTKRVAEWKRDTLKRPRPLSR
jgi:hypothetical protein